MKDSNMNVVLPSVVAVAGGLPIWVFSVDWTIPVAVCCGASAFSCVAWCKHGKLSVMYPIWMHAQQSRYGPMYVLSLTQQACLLIV